MSLEEERKRVLRMIETRNEFVTDVDGLVYYWQTGANGSLTSYVLRWIADELDRRNEETLWKL